MICGWEKRDDYWTNISSPGFDRDQQYRGYLEIHEPALSGLRGFKKNGLRMLWRGSSRILRQEGATDTGFVLRGCPDIFGSRGSESQVQGVRKSETGETALAGEQSLLYKTIFLLCGPEVPSHDRQGCGKGVETGLAYGQGIRQRIHAGTDAEKSGSCTSINRDRRDIFAEGTYVSDCGKRPGKKEADLVRWRGSV